MVWVYVARCLAEFVAVNWVETGKLINPYEYRANRTQKMVVIGHERPSVA